MHELGIVFNIIKQVDEVAKANNVKNVLEVTLEIGEVSGIVNSYLSDCWTWAVNNRSQFMKDCKLNIITIKAKSFCDDCNESFDTLINGKVCPRCKGKNTYLLTGNETIIKNIKVNE